MNGTNPTDADVRELFSLLSSRLSNNASIQSFQELLSRQERIQLSRWQHYIDRHHKGWRSEIDAPSTTKVCNTMKVCNVEGSNKGPRPIVELWLEVEPECNLHCSFCYNYWRAEPGKTPTTLSTRDLVSALRALLSRVDCRTLSISGGEPLLREDLDELLLGLKPFAIPTVITTNGVRLDKDRISRLASCGVAAFQLPLHSTDAGLHDSLSGGTAWQPAISALINLAESGLPTAVVFVATSRNLSHLVPVLHLCAALNIRRIIFNRLVPAGLGKSNQYALGMPHETELVTAISDASVIAARYGQTIDLGVPIASSNIANASMPRVNAASCPVARGQHRWAIGPEGNIRRCNQSEFAIGNLLTDGIERMLNEMLDYDVSSQAKLMPCKILNQATPVAILQRVPHRAGLGHSLKHRRLFQQLTGFEALDTELSCVDQV